MSKPELPGETPGSNDAAHNLDESWVDARVLEGVRRRDPQSLTRFFDLAFPYVYNIAYRLTGHHETAEDITQDVFVKVYQAADKLQPERHPKPWLKTITYNTYRDAMRRAAARPAGAEDASEIGERDGNAPTPEDDVLRRERHQLTERALMALDEEMRAIIVLHDFCDTSHEEIADIMGLSHAAVRKRYSRALKRMAEIIRGLQG